jgi:hypothetical protein
MEKIDRICKSLDGLDELTGKAKDIAEIYELKTAITFIINNVSTIKLTNYRKKQLLFIEDKFSSFMDKKVKECGIDKKDNDREDQGDQGEEDNDKHEKENNFEADSDDAIPSINDLSDKHQM